MVQSDISSYLPLKAYMLALSTAGLAAYGYRTVLGSALVTRHDYKVIGIRPLGNVVEIEMSPQKEPLSFMPGQFIFASFQSQEIGDETHPFSISSGRSDKNLKIGVKALGDFTSRMKELKAGTPVKVEGPFGRLFSQSQKERIWIAGGIGITPFLSMARSMEKDGGKSAHLFYCAANKSETVFLKELLELAATNKKLTVAPFCSEEQGRITAQHVKTASGGLKGKEISICGPPQMMKSLKAQFLELGVPRRSIHAEEFQL